MGRPPADASKKFVPNRRSNINSTKQMVIAGKAKITNNAVIKVIQVNTGNLIKVMPGALILMIVVIKFRAPTIDETPNNWSPTTQKSPA